MLTNRSMPRSTVIPELAYPDIAQAIDWLCDTFGFTLRLRIADHRAQLNVGDGAVVLTQLPGGGSQAAAADAPPPARSDRAHSMMIRVEDVHAHHAHCAQRGGRILCPPVDHFYGERQYSVEDFAGRCWTFSQSIADIDPVSWGGTPGQL